MVTEASSRPSDGGDCEREPQCIKLLYNKPSRTLVAQFRRVSGNGLPIEELYLRAAGDTEYRKIAGGEGEITCWDPLSCRRKPFVIFNAFKLSGPGGDWVSISQIDLPRGDVKRLLDRTTLKVPLDFDAAWVASILDIDDEGRTILCRLALESERDNAVTVQYFVSEIDVATGAISNLVALPNVFA